MESGEKWSRIIFNFFGEKWTEGKQYFVFGGKWTCPFIYYGNSY